MEDFDDDNNNTSSRSSPSFASNSSPRAMHQSATHACVVSDGQHPHLHHQNRHSPEASTTGHHHPEVATSSSSSTTTSDDIVMAGDGGAPVGTSSSSSSSPVHSPAAQPAAALTFVHTPSHNQSGHSSPGAATTNDDGSEPLSPMKDHSFALEGSTEPHAEAGASSCSSSSVVVAAEPAREATSNLNSCCPASILTAESHSDVKMLQDEDEADEADEAEAVDDANTTSICDEQDSSSSSNCSTCVLPTGSSETGQIHHHSGQSSGMVAPIGPSVASLLNTPPSAAASAMDVSVSVSASATAAIASSGKLSSSVPSPLSSVSVSSPSFSSGSTSTLRDIISRFTPQTRKAIHLSPPDRAALVDKLNEVLHRVNTGKVKRNEEDEWIASVPSGLYTELVHGFPTKDGIDKLLAHRRMIMDRVGKRRKRLGNHVHRKPVKTPQETFRTAFEASAGSADKMVVDQPAPVPVPVAASAKPKSTKAPSRKQLQQQQPQQPLLQPQLQQQQQQQQQQLRQHLQQQQQQYQLQQQLLYAQQQQQQQQQHNLFLQQQLALQQHLMQSALPRPVLPLVPGMMTMPMIPTTIPTTTTTTSTSATAMAAAAAAMPPGISLPGFAGANPPATSYGEVARMLNEKAKYFESLDAMTRQQQQLQQLQQMQQLQQQMQQQQQQQQRNGTGAARRG